MSFDYQYISNFVYFPEGVDSQYFFIYSGALYSVRLDRLTLQRSPPNIDDSCDRLAYNGDHAFYAYCNSEQASFTYSTDEETIDAQSNIGTDGIPYVCMSSDSIFQVYLNSTDQSTVVQHNGQRNFTTSGQNLTFGECYDEDTFFLVNDQGIKVLRPSDGSFSTISSSHNSRSFVVFDGPYLVAQGDDPPRVTLYDTSLQSIVAWSGSAMAVGVITDLTLAPSSTSLTAPVPTTTLPVPSTSVPPMSAPTTPTTTPTVPSPTKDTLLKSGELAGIGVAVFVLVVLFSAILITICIVGRKRRKKDLDIALKNLNSPPTPDLSDGQVNPDSFPPTPPASDHCPSTSSDPEYDPNICIPVPESTGRHGQMANGHPLESANAFHPDQVTSKYNERMRTDDQRNNLQMKCTQSFNH